ncbi:MAG TPA: DNA helicase UvrD [Gammaproteobacteria bacterium]|nr:DNA helicase UvrD [Gammaproteobacteria bacterium]
MTDNQQHIKNVSRESLDTFKSIALKAQQKLQESQGIGAEAFASVNTMTDGGAVKRLGSISSSNREGYQALTSEPAISRVVAIDEEGETNTFYISRKSTVPLDGDIKLASYHSPIGRLASITVGNEVTLEIGGSSHYYEVIEKVRYKPQFEKPDWDSKHTVFEGDGYGPLTVESLRALLVHVKEEDIEAALDALLAGGDEDRILEGLRHEVRTSMALRDQPVLDSFQDEIFRLPIDRQLLIMGPPGTGKTTTLIRRLGQKLDKTFLEPEEKTLIDRTSGEGLLHEQSWLMFTPTDLLKHFVKEAFNREQVPASDQRIKTWESHRNDVARNVLGILQSQTSSGKFILKNQLNLLNQEVEENPQVWFEALQEFHRSRILAQLEQGVAILEPLRNETNTKLIDSIKSIMATAKKGSVVAIYRALEQIEGDVIPFVKLLKSDSDKEIRKGFIQAYNKNREFLKELAAFLDKLQLDEELDTEEEFDDDSGDESLVSATSAQKAEKTYNKAIRSLARYKYLKRSVPKGSRAEKIREWLGERIPTDDMLFTIGASIAIQNGLRRFVNASRRYVSEAPATYREFRKESLKKQVWYSAAPGNRRHVGTMELDAIVLLMLKSARELLEQSYISRNLDSHRNALLKLVADQFRNQILVDEATDFSPIQLACMEALTHLKTRSFFACGDFNQRITRWGTRSHEQIHWITNRMDTRSINTVYRQSRKLNEFAGELLEVLGSTLENHGELPEHMHHTGFAPVLAENCSELNEVAVWLSERIREVEQSANIGQMPTVAVLVNSEEEVRPMADALNELLEEVNLRAVACSEGQSLGEGTDVRVFDVQHIKGLEFEAVFFVGIDNLAKKLPDLFGKYLYVGSTRASTYFGMTCEETLPNDLQTLKKRFTNAWE